VTSPTNSSTLLEKPGTSVDTCLAKDFFSNYLVRSGIKPSSMPNPPYTTANMNISPRQSFQWN
jgi:hypothetical protein